MYSTRNRKILPNLPDIALRTVFNYLDYKDLTKMEGVCRRWMKIIESMQRRTILEMSIERLGCTTPRATHSIPFRRLSLTCPIGSNDFLAGVFRRSRLSITRMTTDFHFLATIDQVHVSKDANRKYFSNVEELWLLIIHPDDRVTENFLAIEHQLFSDIHDITLQIHVTSSSTARNVGKIVHSFCSRYPKANVNVELHSDKSLKILEQLGQFPPLKMTKLKLICTDFNQPQFRVDQLCQIMQETKINAKNIGLRDWSIYLNGTSPVSLNPLETFRISSCSIQTVDQLVTALQATASQKLPEVKKKIVKKRKVEKTEDSIEEKPKKKKVIKKVVKKKPFIKKLEIAGQCTLSGLTHLQDRAHMELEKRLEILVPDLDVDCSEIYYCW